jgi:hypothetical protein
MRNAACVMALSVAVGVISATTQSQNSLALDTLTVPADRLTAGCTVSPTKIVLAGGRMHGGLWAGLPIDTNPWRGDDPATVAAIRERVVAPPRVPDTPLLTRGELARWRLQLADDVEEAYAAIYADSGTSLITVYGVRFKTTEIPTLPRRESRPGTLWLRRDRTIIAMSSGGGECSEAVRSYVTEIAAR